MAEDRHALESALRSAFDSTFEGVQIIDREGRYLYVNAAAASHGRRSVPELIGKKMTEVYPGIETTEMYALMQHCMAEQAPQQMVNQFSYPDGHSAWFELRMDPVPMGVLILSLDISTRKAMEQQLHASQRDLIKSTQDQLELSAMLQQSQKMEAMGRLAGGIAHDFNNLLTVITGYTDVALQSVPEGDELHADLMEVSTAAQRASSLTRQLLAFSRKQVLAPRELRVNEVVTSTEKMLRRIIGEEIHLVTRLEADLPVIRFDPSQIEQVIINLAVNARDAMPHGGTLTIETSRVDLSSTPVALALSDTGVGMDEKTQQRVFEPFFTTKPPGEGTGLGLATIYGIVEQSGGHITFDSALGKGTTFVVYLPTA